MEGRTLAGRYQRKGVVTATVLQQRREWVTQRGDVMQAAVGDWWVLDADGAGRSVAPDAFEQTYEHIGGERYRRRGEVSARQATQEELVRTLEGNAMAEPGMWIVTDEAGRSWPVPDAEFQQGYEAVR